jgi:aconitate hydratase
MGTELGATTSVFRLMTPLVPKTRRKRRPMVQLEADEGATYDKEIEIDLATIEPLITSWKPSDVVTVREVSGLAVRSQVIFPL